MKVLYEHRVDIVNVSKITGQADPKALAQAIQEKKCEWALAATQLVGDQWFLFWQREVRMEDFLLTAEAEMESTPMEI